MDYEAHEMDILAFEKNSDSVTAVYGDEVYSKGVGDIWADENYPQK